MRVFGDFLYHFLKKQFLISDIRDFLITPCAAHEIFLYDFACCSSVTSEIFLEIQHYTFISSYSNNYQCFALFDMHFFNAIQKFFGFLASTYPRVLTTSVNNTYYKNSRNTHVLLVLIKSTRKNRLWPLTHRHFFYLAISTIKHNNHDLKNPHYTTIMYTYMFVDYKNICG